MEIGVKALQKAESLKAYLQKIQLYHSLVYTQSTTTEMFAYLCSLLLSS